MTSSSAKQKRQSPAQSATRQDKKGFAPPWEVIEKLRQAIANRELESGTRLKELALTRKYHTSRAAVREALNGLQSEMLVRHLPEGGFCVADVTLADAQNIYETREVLEGLAARLFVERATPKHIAALEKAIQDFISEADKEKEADIDVLLAHRNRVHDILLAGSGNQVIQNILRSLHTRISDLRKRTLSQPGRPKETNEELSAILAAIKDGNADAAEQAAMRLVRQAAKLAYSELRERSGP